VTKRLFRCATIGLLSSLLVSPAAAQIRGVIMGPGARAYPIALSPL
jgi:hypothetical protein